MSADEEGKEEGRQKEEGEENKGEEDKQSEEKKQGGEDDNPKGELEELDVESTVQLQGD